MPPVVLRELVQNNSRYTFFRRWLFNPMGVGAVAQSSPRLARAMVSAIDWDQLGHIVEIGAGLGAFTKALVGHPQFHGRLVVIERDPIFFQQLQEQFPQVALVQSDAKCLVEICREQGVGEVNTVLSGLPMLLLSWQQQYRLLDQVFSTWPRAQVIQFSYRIFGSPISESKLRLHGVTAHRQVPLVLGNLPPASVWVYRRA